MSDLVERGRAYAHEWHNAEVCLEMADRIEALESALTKCRDKFLHYEQLHRLKCTSEGDEKADRNRDMADLCDATLNRSHGDDNGCPI